MELSKKTTILLTPALHEQLARLARLKGVSLGHLIRDACERQYRLVSEVSRTEAVQSLAALDLPVGDPNVMKRESVPDADDLLP